MKPAQAPVSGQEALPCMTKSRARLSTGNVKLYHVLETSCIPPQTRPHLRLPPPPLRPPPPPLRMLDDPRAPLARALAPLDPPAPPPKAFELREFPPPEVLRFPTLSPPRFAL